MITEEHMKEELSRAYLLAVIAQSGMMFSKSELDYGIDGTIKDVEIRIEPDGKKRHVETGFAIDIQLKATVDVEFIDNCIVYKLNRKNYNDLTKSHLMIPRLLLLYILPRDKKKWLQITEKSAVLETGMWWCSLKGQEISSNISTVSIRIPLNQQLTVDSLNHLMEIAKGGEDL